MRAHRRAFLRDPDNGSSKGSPINSSPAMRAVIVGGIQSIRAPHSHTHEFFDSIASRSLQNIAEKSERVLLSSTTSRSD